eukprot:458968_1
MASNRKRSFCTSRGEFEQESNTTIPPTKKRKIMTNTNDNEINQQLPRKFAHNDDEKQFETIYIAVNKSQFATEHKLCKPIVSLISEYATGQLQICYHTKCDNEIVRLNGDDNDNKYYTICKLSERIYCSDCKKLVIKRDSIRDDVECGCICCQQLIISSNYALCHCGYPCAIMSDDMCLNDNDINDGDCCCCPLYRCDLCSLEFCEDTWACRDKEVWDGCCFECDRKACPDCSYVLYENDYNYICKECLVNDSETKKCVKCDDIIYTRYKEYYSFEYQRCIKRGCANVLCRNCDGTICVEHNNIETLRECLQEKVKQITDEQTLRELLQI